jgi:hypothetical protein
MELIDNSRYNILIKLIVLSGTLELKINTSGIFLFYFKYSLIFAFVTN